MVAFIALVVDIFKTIKCGSTKRSTGYLPKSARQVVRRRYFFPECEPDYKMGGLFYKTRAMSESTLVLPSFLYLVFAALYECLAWDLLSFSSLLAAQA
jgi:hypothetical protein